MHFHEVANIFPMMSAEEFEALKLDIAEHGLREPIWTHEGKIIDGRNRYAACEEVGVKPRFREWDGEGSLVGFVLSLNLKRRHLSSSQKAVIALDIEPLLAAEAAKRNGGRPAKNGQKPTQKVEQVINRNERTAAGQTAAILGTNRQYVSKAKRLADTAPELLPLVRDGKASIVEAVAISHNDKKTIEAIIEKVNSGKAKSATDARRLVNHDVGAEVRNIFFAAIEQVPALGLYKDAVERGEIEPVAYSDFTPYPGGWVRWPSLGTFAGLRLRNLTTPFTGQTWYWPKYTGAVITPIDEYLGAASPDLETPLFSILEWEEFTRLDELEAVIGVVFPGYEWFRWQFGIKFTWSVKDFLRKPWAEGHTRRRDYDPEYGRLLVDCFDDSCPDCEGKPMFIRRGWGQWRIVEYNDGQGGRERRRFFEHDHCGPTLIQQAIETLDPLAFSYTSLQRLNIFKAMPVEISWYAMRRKTIHLERAIEELEADLEALRKMQPLTDDELTERVLDWLQAFTPGCRNDWREGVCTYPRLSDGSLNKERYRESNRRGEE